jgi:hypothetical protein
MEEFDENKKEVLTESEILYADIIDMPHHNSARHRRMPMEKRAAQFSSFAALSGHEDAIKDTAEKNILEVETNHDNDDFYDNMI